MGVRAEGGWQQLPENKRPLDSGHHSFHAGPGSSVTHVPGYPCTLPMSQDGSHLLGLSHPLHSSLSTPAFTFGRILRCLAETGRQFSSLPNGFQQLGITTGKV